MCPRSCTCDLCPPPYLLFVRPAAFLGSGSFFPLCVPQGARWGVLAALSELEHPGFCIRRQSRASSLPALQISSRHPLPALYWNPPACAAAHCQHAVGRASSRGALHARGRPGDRGALAGEAPRSGRVLNAASGVRWFAAEAPTADDSRRSRRGPPGTGRFVTQLRSACGSKGNRSPGGEMAPAEGRPAGLINGSEASLARRRVVLRALLVRGHAVLGCRCVQNACDARPCTQMQGRRQPIQPLAVALPRAAASTRARRAAPARCAGRVCAPARARGPRRGGVAAGGDILFAGRASRSVAKLGSGGSESTGPSPNSKRSAASAAGRDGTRAAHTRGPRARSKAPAPAAAVACERQGTSPGRRARGGARPRV